VSNRVVLQKGEKETAKAKKMGAEGGEEAKARRVHWR
jgi:hypothetical protein